MSATTHSGQSDTLAWEGEAGDVPPPPALAALELPVVEMAGSPLRPVYANPAAQALFGAAAGAEVSDWPRRLFGDAGPEASGDDAGGTGGVGLLAVAAEVARDGKARTFEHACEPSDGRARWMSTLVQVGRRRDGRALTVLAVMTDVSDRRQAVESHRRTFSRETVERERGAERLAVEQLASRLLAECPSVAEAAGGILRALGSTLDCPLVTCWVSAPQGGPGAGGVLRCHELSASDALARSELVERTRVVDLRPGEDLPGRAWQKGEAVWYDDLGLVAGDLPRGRLATAAGLHAGAAFPIRAGDETIGAIELYARDARLPDEEVLRLMTSIGQQIGQALGREVARRALADLERALQAIPAGIAMIDMQGALVYANDLLAQVCGFPSGLAMREVPVTQVFGRFQLWDEGGRLLSPREIPSQVAVASEQEVERVLLFQLAGGAARWLSVRAIPLRDGAGRLFRVVVVLADITERRRAARWQRFLGEASAALASSMDADLVMRVVADLAVRSVAAGCAVDMSRPDGTSWRRVAAAGGPGLAVAGESEGAVPELAAPPPPPSQRAAEVRAGLSGPAPAASLSVPLSVRGQVIGVLTLAAPAGGPGYGEADLAAAEDLGRRVSITIDNVRLYGETQDSLRAREDLLAIVSHDLRNPLGVVLASSALLLKSSLPPEKEERARRQVEAIQRAGNRMNRLIKDLLDFASIQGGRLTITPRPHEAASLVSEVLTILEPLATQKTLRFENELGEQPLYVSCDHDRLIQAFSNVVGNAIKFTPEGGTIRVGAVREGAGQGKGEGPSGQPAMVRFFVADTGPGIPADQVEHVFDRYFQAQRKNREGIGLGLSIAKGIIDAHGGRIWVESEEDKGSTFFVALPAAD